MSSRSKARFSRLFDEREEVDSPTEEFLTVDLATAMIWKILQLAAQTFRRLNAPELLPAVYAGAMYVDGMKQIAVSRPEVAA